MNNSNVLLEESVFAQLQRCVEKGLLLHGSRITSINILRAGERPICATNVPAIAMMYAIRPDETFLPPSGWEIWAVENLGPGSRDFRIRATKGFMKKAGSGSVYVVEPGQFQKGKANFEFVAFSPVRPVERVDVVPSDLPYKIDRLSRRLRDYYRSELVRQDDILLW